MTYSRYHLCDLQVHTPADKAQGFGDWGGRDPNAAFADEFMQKAKGRGVTAIAVTDHNRVDWYPTMNEAGVSHGIAVFPGVEISVGRCHLLMLFEASDEGYDLATKFLDTCWEPKQPRFKDNGDPLPVGKGQVVDVAQRAGEVFGALVLAPHSTEKRIGFFASGVCSNREQIIKERLISGFDVTGDVGLGILSSPQELFPKDELPVPWFISGDIRTFDDIGVNATYLKMGGQPTLEGLRQAMLMPSTRIRLPASLKDRYGHVHGVEFLDDPTPSWARLTRVSIQGGFHSDLSIDVAPGLTAIIGGKGTGKSALIEIIRYSTESREPATDDLDENRRENFRANAEATIGIVNAAGHSYDVRRIGESNAAQLLTPDGEPTEVAVPMRFRMRVFGQRELQRLGDEGEILRDFVASTSGESHDEAEASERAIRQELSDINLELTRIESEISKHEELAAELADNKEKLEQARRAGVDGLLTAQQRLSDTDTKVKRALGWPESVQSALGELRGCMPRPEIPEDDTIPNEIDLVLGELERSVGQACTDIEGQTSSAIERLADPEKQWDGHVEEVTQEATRALADAGVRDAKQLAGIQTRVSQLEEKIRGLSDLQQSLADLLQRRTSCLGNLGNVVREKSRIVERAVTVLNRNLSGRVQLKVDPLADRSATSAWLRDALARKNVQASQIRRLAEKQPGQIAEAAREGANALAALGCSESTASKLVDVISNEELRALEELPTPDVVVAQVNLGSPENPVWKDVSGVSPGQRATALLSLVLLSSDEPLVIDQPEDDLDNQHIYEDIVQVIARVCQRRQVIVATHNANIPVLGDAELVVALDADAQASHVEAVGGFEQEEVSSYARRVLEGGEEAFKARLRRYRPS